MSGFAEPGASERSNATRPKSRHQSPSAEGSEQKDGSYFQSRHTARGTNRQHRATSRIKEGRGESGRTNRERQIEGCLTGLLEAISETIDPLTALDSEVGPIVRCVIGLWVAAFTCGALAAIRQAFRLPDAASTAMVSGCKSSVREMTGNSSARMQTIAAASIVVLWRGFLRETIHRNRHSQTAARVIASQTRFRKVSIDSR